MTFMHIQPGHCIPLPGHGGRPDQVHVFEEDMIDAIDAALAAQRPLLVRGEPGIGKSQLARAAAKHLGRVFLSLVVDSRTEASDLLWHYDAVARLADAQMAGAPRARRSYGRKDLAVRNYLCPGPLWWAFDWNNAASQARLSGHAEPPQERDLDFERKSDPANGSVILIDEIDKAESELPNGLLGALGNGEFTPPGRATPVVARADIAAPLVVITTNNERSLPDAFVRRCLVLHLEMPEASPDQLRDFLCERGRRHFPKADEKVLNAAAERLAEDRRAARENRCMPLPGQAEYLDLVRAVTTLKTDAAAQLESLEKLRRYVFRKHSDGR